MGCYPIHLTNSVGPASAGDDPINGSDPSGMDPGFDPAAFCSGYGFDYISFSNGNGACVTSGAYQEPAFPITAPGDPPAVPPSWFDNPQPPSDPIGPTQNGNGGVGSSSGDYGKESHAVPGGHGPQTQRMCYSCGNRMPDPPQRACRVRSVAGSLLGGVVFGAYFGAGVGAGVGALGGAYVGGSIGVTAGPVGVIVGIPVGGS